MFIGVAPSVKPAIKAYGPSKAHGPRWKTDAPNRSDSPSRVCTPKPSFAMLFADMNFSVSALQIPHDAQTETSQCKLWYTIEELRRLLDKQAIMHVTHPG